MFAVVFSIIHLKTLPSTQTYGQKYDIDIFEPRRWIDRPGGVGDIGEGLPTFGFGRR
jgi:hypothetical protein